jgi:Kef-type K+ transport system membrane component KefB
MIDVAILLCVAAIAFAIRRALHIPLIPLLLLAGMGLRYSHLALDDEIARGVLDVGLAVLVFSAGMELNPKRFGQHQRLVLGIGFSQFALIGCGGILISKVMGLPWLSALYVGLAISTSSTLIVIRLLKSRQQMFEPFGRIVTGVLLLQDLLIILLIVLLTRLSDGILPVLQGLGSLILLLALAYACLRYLMPYMVLRMKLDQEALGLAILMVLFIFMGIAHLLRLPIITGAFLAGVSLSAFPVNSVARGLISSITFFFMATFFVVLGGLINWLSPNEWPLALLLTLFILIATPLLVTYIGLKMGLHARSAIESGLLLAMTSEFSLLVVLQGLLLGQIPEHVFNIVAITSVLTMTLTPLLATDRVTWRLMHWLPGSSPALNTRSNLPENGHIIMLGYGKGSSVVLKALRRANHDVVIVNDDPVVVRELIADGVHAICGDGSDPRILTRILAPHARLIISSMRRVSDAEAVLRHLAPNSPPLIIRVFEPDSATRIRALGGLPVLTSAAAADAFMKWFEQVYPRTPSDATDTSPLEMIQRHRNSLPGQLGDQLIKTATETGRP